MATIKGSNVLDNCLLDIADCIRGCVNETFGTREYRVYSVVRTYTMDRQDGYYSDNILELLPAPKVEFLSPNGFEMIGTGKTTKGSIKITELSLLYSEDQILPQNLDNNQKHFIKLVDRHGENARERYFHISNVPVMDRHKTIGWIFYATEIGLNDYTLNGIT